MDANELMMHIIHAVQAHTLVYKTQDTCLDCGGKQLNYSLNHNDRTIVVHNCFDSELQGQCCSCHTYSESYPTKPDGTPGVEIWTGNAYYGGGQEDSEQMEQLAWDWAKAHNIV